MCKKIQQDNRFSNLGTPNRIWAVSAVHGNLEKLVQLHDNLYDRISPGDRLVYHGNYTGHGAQSAACVDEILTFRRLVMAKPGMMCGDIVYLRGRQEEIWQNLLQLQFAPDPVSVLLWMLSNGLGQTLQSYGICHHEGIEACRYGVMGLTKWTNTVRQAVRRHKGHETFATQLKRAAFTAQHSSAYPMLFVHAGLDTDKTLDDQGDSFWWATDDFNDIDQPYLPFQKVVRGFDPGRSGVNMNCVTATIDGGCGFGGNLICAGFDLHNQDIDLLEI